MQNKEIQSLKRSIQAIAEKVGADSTGQDDRTRTGPTTSERAATIYLHTATSTAGMVRLSALLAVPCASDVGVRGMLGP